MMCVGCWVWLYTVADWPRVDTADEEGERVKMNID